MNLTDLSVDEIKRNPEKMKDLRELQRNIWLSMPPARRDAYFNFRGRQECARRAQTRPLPGEAAGAFLNGEIEVCGKTIRRFVPAHFMVLQKIESPLLEMIAEAVASKQSTRDLSLEEQADLCFIFTSDPKEVFEISLKGGKDAIRKAAHEIILKWEAHEIEFVVNGIFEQYVRHMQTKSRVLTEEAEKGEVRFFREPTPEAK